MDDRNRMDRHAPWMPWALTSLALVLVAIVAYSFGAHHQAVTGAGEPVRRFHGGFPGFWVFFALFWMLFGVRRMWWGYYPCRPWRYGRYGYDPYGDPRDDWEDWHRRAHERLDASAARGTSSSPGADRGSTTT